MRATIPPLAVILTAVLWALVGVIALGSLVAFILPPLCFLYYYPFNLRGPTNQTLISTLLLLFPFFCTKETSHDTGMCMGLRFHYSSGNVRNTLNDSISWPYGKVCTTTSFQRRRIKVCLIPSSRESY